MKRDIEVREDEKTVDLAAMGGKALADLVALNRQIAVLTKRADELKEWVKQALTMSGATVGTVAGVPVVTHRPTAKFAAARFVKDHRDIAQHYMVERTVRELAAEALVADHPILADRYQTRQLLVDDAGLEVALQKVTVPGGAA